jgi:hypothetical protein
MARRFDRRSFLATGAATAASLSAPGLQAQSVSPVTQPALARIINAYYFRAHMYTAVPHHIRDDMMRMADLGTTHVSIAVLEQDFRAAHHNIALIQNEAARAGMRTFAVPSRWCGFFAGAPKVPSEFAAERTDTWMLKTDGSPVISGPSGPLCSLFHPDVQEYMLRLTTQLFDQFDFDGMVMDEPKKLHSIDYSDHARRQFDGRTGLDEQLSARLDFYNSMGALMKQQRAGASFHLFMHASNRDEWIKLPAQMPMLDYFGCDGRPWATGATNERNWNRKCLLPDNLDAYIQIAQQAGKKTLCLAENYDLPDRYVSLWDEGFPEVARRPIDHLIYYWYPRNAEDPEAQMKVVKKRIAEYAGR